MNNTSNHKQAIIGLAAIIAGLFVVIAAFGGSLQDAIIPIAAALLVLVGLPLAMRALHGRTLQIIGIGALGFATVAGPLAYLLANVTTMDYGDPSGLATAAYILLWLILLPIVWLEHLRARKLGKGLADVERSYRLIIIVVTLFELLPMLIAALRSVQLL